MKRPIVAVVSCYAIGLLLAEIFQPPLTELFISAFATFALALILPRFRPLLICLLLALAGWTNLIFHTAVISPNDLRALLGNETAIFTVCGTLTETPHLKVTGLNDQQTEHSLAQVRVTELRRDDNWQPALGKIIVTTPSALPENFFAGQPVEISGIITRPPPPLAEGLFDDRDYLQTRGIFYELKTSSTNDWQLRTPILSTPPLTDRFLNWSKRTLAIGLPVEDEPLRLLWAMTLGWRTAFTGDIADPFLRAGTMHLFAIDGLRIALISGMLVALLRVLQVSRAWCGIVAIPAIWFYTAATGWESSAIRASVMMTIVLGGWALKRPGDLINSLAAAAFLILLWEPRQLFEASFQLSFFCHARHRTLAAANEQNFRWIFAPRSAFAKRFDSQMASLFDSNFANARALFFTFACGMARFNSAFREIFSPVQPHFDFRKHRRRSARHSRADEQSRRAHLRLMVSIRD